LFYLVKSPNSETLTGIGDQKVEMKKGGKKKGKNGVRKGKKNIENSVALIRLLFAYSQEEVLFF
jgi:hypothetical protein